MILVLTLPGHLGILRSHQQMKPWYFMWFLNIYCWTPEHPWTLAEYIYDYIFLKGMYIAVEYNKLTVPYCFTYQDLQGTYSVKW